MLAGTHNELADHKARVFPSSASATSEVGRKQHLPNGIQEVGRLPSDDADGHARRTGIDIRVRCDAWSGGSVCRWEHFWPSQPQSMMVYREKYAFYGKTTVHRWAFKQKKLLAGVARGRCPSKTTIERLEVDRRLLIDAWVT